MRSKLNVISILASLMYICGMAEAASRNQTYSEPYIAFTYNSHMINHTWGEPGTGVPFLQGYFYFKGDKDEKVMPNWLGKALRICMSL